VKSDWSPFTTAELSDAERLSIRDAIRDAIVTAWLDADNPDSLTNQVINPILALSGTGVNGPSLSVDGDDAQPCGGSGNGTGALRLAG
jgi:hypothetical protein